MSCCLASHWILLFRCHRALGIVTCGSRIQHWDGVGSVAPYSWESNLSIWKFRLWSKKALLGVQFGFVDVFALTMLFSCQDSFRMENVQDVLKQADFDKQLFEDVFACSSCLKFLLIFSGFLKCLNLWMWTDCLSLKGLRWNWFMSKRSWHFCFPKVPRKDECIGSSQAWVYCIIGSSWIVTLSGTATY